MKTQVKKYLAPALFSVIAVAGLSQAVKGWNSWNETREQITVAQQAAPVAQAAPVTLALFNPVVVAPTAQASQPQLALDISGIIFSNDDDLSAAVIKQGAEQVIYHVGESVQGYDNAKITAISKDHIEVSYHGAEQNIKLPEPDYKKQSA